MGQKDNLLLAFYGDDFTGSTDALEFLTIAGVKTILFLKTPKQEDLDQFSGLQAIGIAGKSRSLMPLDMEEELRPVFKIIKTFNPDHFHYKVCSTFDSAPHIGNIGKAIEIGSAVFNQDTVFVSPAAPHLGRYTVFGNLFAKMGTVGNGAVYRIDRHPSMSNHPVTPAEEANLTKHLAQQTEKPIGLVDISVIEEGKQAVITDIKAKRDTGILFFDAFNTSHLETIGTVFHALKKDSTLFSVGSSGIEMALGLAWKSKGIISKEAITFKALGEVSPLLVLSGSCSPVTADQINYALNHGFLEIPLGSDAVDILNHEAIIEATVTKVIENFKQGKSTILHTSIGPKDSRITETELYFKKQGVSKSGVKKRCSEIYGSILGQITKKVITQVGIKRVLLAGGDTSSYAASELNITALEMIAPLAPGAPLCKAISDTKSVNGLELNFKGGQVGTENYFIKVLKGEQL